MKGATVEQEFFTVFDPKQIEYKHPDQSGVYLQCHAVYAAAPLQHMQCTCSVG